MDTSLAIITIYVIVETILKKLIEKPRQEQKLTDIEIITIGISASLFFNSNHGKALCWLKLAGYFPKMLCAQALASVTATDALVWFTHARYRIESD